MSISPIWDYIAYAAALNPGDGGIRMDQKQQRLFDDVNRAIIGFRGVYSDWSYKHGISYNEMLVLYTLREKGYCTQKQICDSYKIPKQTINNIISSLRRLGVLIHDDVHSKNREKAFVLSEKGKEYAAPFLKSLNEIESEALNMLGDDKIKALIGLLSEYNRALNLALNASR